MDPAVIQLLPVVNGRHETICYAYQDREANRELRMLRELDGNEKGICFQDIFPEIQNVIVCGCNELAYYFVLYLQKQKINVSVSGKYWNFFGYENNTSCGLGGKGTMVINAEEISLQTDSLYQTVIRSASSCFECVDQIYEANMAEGKIRNTIGNFEEILEKIRGRNVAILGTNMTAQDTYDLLYGHGIDICCFAVFESMEKGECRTLLGKKVVGVEEIIKNGEDMVFIDNNNQNSALGTGNSDIFDYYGYERNESFFLLRDYTEIPCSCLKHVLNGRRVLLAGDERLCSILLDYLVKVNQGNVDIQYTDIFQMKTEETGTLCIVYPWYGFKKMQDNPKRWVFQKQLSGKKNLSYTDYFSHTEVFIMIDLFMNRDTDKYSVKQLTPKGILLGRIPGSSGNVFFRGLLDGHPDILQWGDTHLNANLFLYCIRLSSEKSENIVKVFRKLFDEELVFEKDADLLSGREFEENMQNLLSLKEHFTSQELFVLFHIAYAGAYSGRKITNIHCKIIYWEPHWFPRDAFPYLARWLDSDRVDGHTIFMHRDNIVWTGSNYKSFCKENPASLAFIRNISRERWIETDRSSYMNWEEFQVRFEDIKLHPREELLKICDICDISWSDTMLCTTYRGESWGFKGAVYDFDLKPVLNRYEEYLSEFDHFKISLISNSYQKKYGYSYEDCRRFSRRELQEIFLKEFRFQQKLLFSGEKERKAYFLRAYALLQEQLWIMRIHTVMEDIVPEFDAVRFKSERSAETLKGEEIENLINFVKNQKRLILYGIGRDCEGLLNRLNESEQSEIMFCDKKAEYEVTVFRGKKVLAPRDLCKNYKDYMILVTSSMYYDIIQHQLEELSISPNKIVCNKVQLWEEEG